MSGHEEKTLQNTTVVIDKAKNCFSLKIQPHKDEIQLLLFFFIVGRVFLCISVSEIEMQKEKKLSYILKDLVQYHVGSVSSAIIHQCTRNTSGRRQIQEVKKRSKRR